MTAMFQSALQRNRQLVPRVLQKLDLPESCTGKYRIAKSLRFVRRIDPVVQEYPTRFVLAEH